MARDEGSVRQPSHSRLALLAAVLASAAACSVITGFGDVVLERGDGDSDVDSDGDSDVDSDGDGDADGCVSGCGVRECGPDGCGGLCGTCPGDLVCDGDGFCQIGCDPSCVGRECGPDGCGGLCGTCPGDLVCDSAGRCVTGCVAECAGRECGPDGCDGACGLCPDDKVCDEGSGQCRALCGCDARECGDDGCGEWCGDCPSDLACDAMVGRCVPPDCLPGDGIGRPCGPGGSCVDSECLRPDLFPTRGVCTHRCEPDSECPDPEGLGYRCFDLGTGTGWCLLPCGTDDDCPCRVPCRTIAPRVGVCFPD